MNNRSTATSGSEQNGNSISADSIITLNMYNSIIEETKNADGTSYGGTDCQGLDNSVSNIIQDGSCAHSNNSTADPLLGGRSGGTRPYYPLRAGSPAR